MKDTLEKIVSSKNADQPLATFLGRLCEEAGKKKCDKFKAALMGNTEAKGRKKAHETSGERGDSAVRFSRSIASRRLTAASGPYGIMRSRNECALPTGY